MYCIGMKTSSINSKLSLLIKDGKFDAVSKILFFYVCIQCYEGPFLCLKSDPITALKSLEGNCYYIRGSSHCQDVFTVGKLMNEKKVVMDSDTKGPNCHMEDGKL